MRGQLARENSFTRYGSGGAFFAAGGFPGVQAEWWRALTLSYCKFYLLGRSLRSGYRQPPTAYHFVIYPSLI